MPAAHGFTSRHVGGAISTVSPRDPPPRIWLSLCLAGARSMASWRGNRAILRSKIRRIRPFAYPCANHPARSASNRENSGLPFARAQRPASPRTVSLSISKTPGLPRSCESNSRGLPCPHKPAKVKSGPHEAQSRWATLVLADLAGIGAALDLGADPQFEIFARIIRHGREFRRDQFPIAPCLLICRTGKKHRVAIGKGQRAIPAATSETRG